MIFLDYFVSHKSNLTLIREEKEENLGKKRYLDNDKRINQINLEYDQQNSYKKKYLKIHTRNTLISKITHYKISY